MFLFTILPFGSLLIIRRGTISIIVVVIYVINKGHIWNIPV
jgi:hypothetical protein